MGGWVWGVDILVLSISYAVSGECWKVAIGEGGGEGGSWGKVMVVLEEKERDGEEEEGRKNRIRRRKA